MGKINNVESATSRKVTGKQANKAPNLTPEEWRALYLLQENHVSDIVNVASLLDEGQRRLAVRMLQAMVDHKRSMLS
ncbi:MAG: hypothetical protein ACXIVE_10440 [Salinarimonas sp.]